MVLCYVNTVRATNPQYSDYLLIKADKLYLLPQDVFIKLVIDAGRRFKTIAPLAPYPNPFPELLGVKWETNQTIYNWFCKKLKEYEKLYPT